MTKNILLITFIFIFNIRMFGQEICNCNADLNFVIEKIEKEHPGFSVNVTDKNIEFYNIVCYSFIKDNQFNCKYIIIIM